MVFTCQALHRRSPRNTRLSLSGMRCRRCGMWYRFVMLSGPTCFFKAKSRVIPAYPSPASKALERSPFLQGRRQVHDFVSEMPRLNLLIDEATLLKTYKIGTLTPTYALLIMYRTFCPSWCESWTASGRKLIMNLRIRPLALCWVPSLETRKGIH